MSLVVDYNWPHKKAEGLLQQSKKKTMLSNSLLSEIRSLDESESLINVIALETPKHRDRIFHFSH